ncbi:hypothetical protein HanIR_Chr03g0101871 [Helianthus annuus]|nr:hypothetical protein HanIR_Chr03g0101871 [Helianthus annuus]
MIKAWWIRRWYFLYISSFIILHIVVLSKPLQQRQDMTYFIHIIFIWLLMSHPNRWRNHWGAALCGSDC